MLGNIGEGRIIRNWFDDFMHLVVMFGVRPFAAKFRLNENVMEQQKRVGFLESHR